MRHHQLPLLPSISPSRTNHQANCSDKSKKKEVKKDTKKDRKRRRSSSSSSSSLSDPDYTTACQVAAAFGLTQGWKEVVALVLHTGSRVLLAQCVGLRGAIAGAAAIITQPWSCSARLSCLAGSAPLPGCFKLSPKPHHQPHSPKMSLRDLRCTVGRVHVHWARDSRCFWARDSCCFRIAPMVWAPPWAEPPWAESVIHTAGIMGGGSSGLWKTLKLRLPPLPSELHSGILVALKISRFNREPNYFYGYQGSNEQVIAY